MIKWYIDGDYVEAHIDDNIYYCTGEDGYGLFIVNSERNERKQILGTAQFSVYGIKDKKRKMRKYIAE